jgi:hypothetical protein
MPREISRLGARLRSQWNTGNRPEDIRVGAGAVYIRYDMMEERNLKVLWYLRMIYCTGVDTYCILHSMVHHRRASWLRPLLWLGSFAAPFRGVLADCFDIVVHNRDLGVNPEELLLQHLFVLPIRERR